MDYIFEFLSQENIFSIIVGIIITFFNLIYIKLRTSKSKAEKELIKASKEIGNLLPNDYLIKIGSTYYTLDEVKFVLKSDVSIDDFVLSNQLKEVNNYVKKNDE